MNKIVYLSVNALVTTFTIQTVVEMVIEETSMSKILFFIIMMYVVFNTLLFLGIYIMDYLVSKLDSFLERKKKKKYSLFNWLSDPYLTLDFRNELLREMDFDSKNFHENYQKIKEKIKENKSLNDLKALKMYMEMKTESPRYNSILSSTQTILIAVLTTALITMYNIDSTNVFERNKSLIFFGGFWAFLLLTIDYISKEIDRNKLLLKLISECVEEEEKRKKSKT
ncbi:MULTISPECIES: hypothetical protein [Bacillaceae]|uniref:Uncharacterized protein n=1 Tax=Domibacillus aminovorans TaxID=29332 RepID=A0A177KXP9_9BACI|nr:MULTISPECIES: hypothetical protein [Bacillaceae]OAH57774.1 hypothetical protein AWH48_01780 [Domibacillus aminovorans]